MSGEHFCSITGESTFHYPKDCLIDGSATEGVHRQLRRLPKDVTHLIGSVGGNEALYSRDILIASVHR